MIFLIVEDSRPTRNLIKSYVKEITHNRYDDFLEAENSETAMQLLHSQRVDFVFLDLNLYSEKTGLDLIKEIRGNDKFKQLPLVMVSSESDKVNVIEALKNGANDFVAKPIDKKSFSEKVLKIINK